MARDEVMRILNRPMFKYGGPIKEGVMHGMRDGGKAALVGNPVYPQTGGREHHATSKVLQYGSKMLPSIGRWWNKIKPTGKFRQPPIPKGYPTGQSRQIGSRLNVSGKGFEGPAPYTKMEMLKNPKLLWEGVKENPWWTAGGALYGGKPLYETGKATIPAVVKQAADLAVPDWIWDQDKYFADKEKKKLLEEAALTTEQKEIERLKKLLEGKTTDEVVDPDAAAKLAKTQQGERLQSYLDMMGYDSAKKGAMSKALIDASALVQDATTEAGSIKHADWGNLINKAIQTTSRRMEKPEQIREAVGLMMTKAELEKDVLKSKGSPQKQYAQELVDAGVYKTLAEALAAGSKKPTFRDNLFALSGKDGVSGEKITLALQSTPGEKTPTKTVKGSDTAYQKFKEKMQDAGNDSQIELEFVDKMITDKQPGDSFIIDDSLIIVKSDGTLDYRYKQ